MSKRDDFVAGAKEQSENGSIYVRGSQGQPLSVITEAWVTMREHGVVKEIRRVLSFLQLQIERGFTKLRAFDCSGLVMWLLAQLGYIIPDKSANSIYYDLCKAIGKYDLCPGDLVFKKYVVSNRMFHVGIYMGNGTVVHCKGRDDGVVREKLSATGWNRFGRLKCLPGGMVTCLLRTIKKRCSGDDVRALQHALNMTGAELKEDGAFGPLTDAAFRAWQEKHPACGTHGKPDGKCGPMSANALGLMYVR